MLKIVEIGAVADLVPDPRIQDGTARDFVDLRVGGRFVIDIRYTYHRVDEVDSAGWPVAGRILPGFRRALAFH